MLTLAPCIQFNGTAREAMEFYADVFGGALRVDAYGDFTTLGFAEADTDLIMHAQLETPYGLTLIGADTPSGVKHDAGARVQLS